MVSNFTPRGEASLDDIIFTLAVNFLLYVTLIIVFYMLVRFYLEEEVTNDYSKVPTEDKETTETTESSTVDKSMGILEAEVEDDGEKPSESTSTPMKRSSSFLNVNEEEPQGTRQEVIRKIVFCAVGLNITFGIWGLVQERLLTQTYAGEFFEFSYGLVFINRLGGLLLSVYLMYHFKVDWVSSPLWEYSIPSVANMLSSWCQYEALKYVSFPTQMLAKAFKMVPVMLMGKFLHNKAYESYEYIAASTVGFGLYLFIDSTEHIDFKQNVFGDPEGVKGAYCGVVLLILFLFFDSFTGQWQTRMFQIYKDMSPLQMMLIMNAFSAVFSFITLIHQEELQTMLSFVFNHSEMWLHLLLFCICSTIGQLFIFYTVKSFGAVIFSIIMSMRILLSTLLSCLVYNHPITEMGYLGMIIVFGAIWYRTQRKTEGKALIRWRESDDDSKLIFHEWHEHVDV